MESQQWAQMSLSGKLSERLADEDYAWTVNYVFLWKFWLKFFYDSVQIFIIVVCLMNNNTAFVSAFTYFSCMFHSMNTELFRSKVNNKFDLYRIILSKKSSILNHFPIIFDRNGTWGLMSNIVNDKGSQNIHASTNQIAIRR